MRATFIIIFLISTMAAAEENTPVYLCGRQLADARLALCYGIGIDKRSSQNDIFDQLNEDIMWKDGYHMWDGRRGSLSADWTRYKRTGIADECCLNPCTRDIIMTYC